MDILNILVYAFSDELDYVCFLVTCCDRCLETGDYVIMRSSKVNCVAGFNNQVEEYYVARATLVRLLTKDKTFKEKFGNPNATHDHVCPIFSKINRQKLLAHQCHMGWRHQMLFRWINVTAT